MAVIVLNGRVCAHSEVSGVERYAGSIFSYLQKRQAHNYIVARPQSAKGWRGHVWEQCVLPAACLSARAELLFCPSGSIPLLPVRIPVVVTEHDLAYRWFPAAYRLPYRVFYAAMTPILMQKAARIVTVSEAERARIANVYPACREKLVVIHNGISESFFRMATRDRRENPSLLYVGSLSTKKNLLGLLEAFKIVHTKIPHRLRLVGPSAGQLREDSAPVQALLRALPPDRVEVLGYVRDEEALCAIYQEASLFVFPSLYEAFGFPVLEAMAAGVPVVASDLPALREVAEEKVVYCNPYDPRDIANSILEGLQRREEFIERGREHARRFTWDHSASALEEVFNSVLSTHG